MTGRRREGSKIPVACYQCRARKVKCDGLMPCKSCSDHHDECGYPVPHQRTSRLKREKQLEQRNRELEERLLQMSALMPLTAPTPMTVTSGTDMASSILSPPQPPGSSESVRANSLYQDAGTINPTPRVLHNATRGQLMADRHVPLGVHGAPSSSAHSKDENTVSSHHTNSEHHGPITWLSICSKAAVEWVSKQTGQSTFAESAAHMAFNLTRRLKLDKFPQNAAVSEPDEETARRFTQAYFEERLDRAFTVVDRSCFQDRLDAHFEDGGKSGQEDPAWYALRNVVYAYGCRIELSRHNSSVQAQSQAWKYFENALSVHVNLLYIRTDITAVQALVAMAFFVNSLGSPSLEYMLVENAVLLAYAKGLHLAVPSALKPDEAEIQKRNHLFWSIYCLEKDICFRSGRPSSIDDEDISCSVPVTTVNSPLDLQLLSGSIRLAQVLSRTCKSMLSVKGLERSLEDSVVVVQELEEQLEAWRQSLPPCIRPGTEIECRLEKTHLGHRVDKVHLNHILHLRVAYHISLSAIHSIFFYPWNSLRFGPLEKDPALEKQVQTSTETVAQAARSIILSARQIVVDSSTLRSLGLVFPLVGLINLFVYILKHPTHPGVASDLLLMEIAAGYFSYLEFVLEDHSTFQFAKAFKLYAKAAVKYAGNNGAGNSASSYAPTLGELETLIFNTYSAHDQDSILDMNDFNIDSWQNWLSFPNSFV